MTLAEAFHRRPWLAPTLVGLSVAALLLLTATQGFVRDEGYYFKASREYHGWFEELWRNLLALDPAVSFSDAGLVRHFSYNTEHPGLVKLLMGWSWKVLHVWLGATSSATGFRAGAIALVSLGAAFLYAFAARLRSPRVGVVAVALLMACPHVFFHSHLAAFDGPIMALTVVTTYAFWRSLDDPRWVVGAGIAFGLALATKHNAVFLVPTFVGAVLLVRWREFSLAGGRLATPSLPLALVSMAVLGPLVLYVCYPYGWLSPLARLGQYYGYHLRHEHYPVDYFGTLYVEPPFPWSYPWVMSAITVPLPILCAGVLGLGLCLRRAISREAAVIDWLLVLSVLVPPFIISIPSVPIFGGTKHWMPMMPFFCLLAAWALDEAGGALRRFGRVGAYLPATLVLALAVVETARTHPYGHTYFNELVLGHQGAAALGMPRTFWGGDARGLLDVVNSRAAPGARVFAHRMNWYDFQAYQADGLLRRDLVWANELRSADWAFINHQREYQDEEYELWQRRGDRRPAAVVEFDGVPIVSVYELEAKP